MFEGKLTQKQRSFAEAIFKGESATDAYFCSGYSVTSRNAASVEASRLLRNPRVEAYLNYLRSQVEQEIVIDHVALIRELNAIALTRVNHLISLEDGQPLPLEELTADDRLAAVSEFSIDEVEGEHGTRRNRKLKTHSKKSAIETLLKIQGYTNDLSSALRTLEAYGIKLRQSTDGKWFIED